MSRGNACIDKGPGGVRDTLHYYEGFSALIRATPVATRARRVIDTQGRVTFIRQRPPVRQQDSAAGSLYRGADCDSGVAVNAVRGEESFNTPTPSDKVRK